MRINGKRIKLKLLDRSYYFSVFRSAIFRTYLSSSRTGVLSWLWFASTGRFSYNRNFIRRFGQFPFSKMVKKKTSFIHQNIRFVIFRHIFSKLTHHSEMFEGTRFWAEVKYVALQGILRNKVNARTRYAYTLIQKN